MKTMTITKLDPSYEVHHVSITDEHEKPLHFTKDGVQIPYIEETVPYKPEYDIEISRKNGVASIDLYRDIHNKVGTYTGKRMITARIKMLIAWRIDKFKAIYL